MAKRASKQRPTTSKTVSHANTVVTTREVIDVATIPSTCPVTKEPVDSKKVKFKASTKILNKVKKLTKTPIVAIGGINFNNYKTIELEITTNTPPVNETSSYDVICDEDGNIIGINKPANSIYEYTYEQHEE